MTQIDELQKKYPSIPRDVIVKHHVLVQGIKDNEDLDKGSSWKPASGAYQSDDYDVTLADIARNTPWRAKPGYMLRPNDMRFRSGLGAMIRLRSTSAYTVREVSEGNFAVCEGEEEVEDIYFPRLKRKTIPEPVTSKGTPISRLIGTRFSPNCFSVIPVRHCEYFGLGLQCRFCNYNASHDDARSVGLNNPVTISLEETVEAYKIRSSGVRQLEGSFVMGGFMDAEHEARIYLNFVEKIASAASYKPNLSVHTHAMDRKDMQRLKDVGLDSIRFQIEVMDPQLFAEICPGKNKRMPYERWIEAFHDAVDVFGAGSVGAKLIPGLTLLSPNGHKTWQDARDHHIEANTWLIKNGVVPLFFALWWAPGSVYSQDRSNLEKFPPTEYHLEVGLAHHEAMLKYDLYKKMNKFMYCALDRLNGPYGGEIGMLNLAGDLGSWMADVVPPELNWLARFIASVKSPAKTQ